jgi:hypothetical protein
VRLFDTIKSKTRDRRFEDELRSLAEKIAEGRWKRDIVIAHAPLPTLAGALLDFEGLFSSFQVPEHPSAADTLRAAELFKQILALQEGRGVENALLALLEPLAQSLPALPEGEDFGLWVSVVERLPNPVAVVDGIVRTALVSPPLPRLSHVVRSNLLLASGIDPENPTRRQLVMPTMAKEAAPVSLVQTYLRGTPFVDFFCTPYPFTIPASIRFEHTHIVGGAP